MQLAPKPRLNRELRGELIVRQLFSFCRPKEVRELARTHTEAAINRLAFWMQSEDPRASVAASNALLDRGYGKPVAPIEMDHHVNEFDGMTEEELAEYLGANVEAWHQD